MPVYIFTILKSHNWIRHEPTSPQWIDDNITMFKFYIWIILSKWKCFYFYLFNFIFSRDVKFSWKTVEKKEWEISANVWFESTIQVENKIHKLFKSKNVWMFFGKCVNVFRVVGGSTSFECHNFFDFSFVCKTFSHLFTL